MPIIGKTDTKSTPFLSMCRAYRVLLVLTFCLSCLDHLVFAWNTQTFASWVLFLTKLFATAVALIPVIFFRPIYGWFHPLIFPLVVSALRTVLLYGTNLLWGDNLSAIVLENDALPGISEVRMISLFIKEQLLTATGFAFYYLAFYLSDFKHTASICFRTTKFLPLKTILFTLIGCAIFVFYTNQVGGVEAHLMNWQGGRKANIEGIGYLTPLVALGAISCLVWLENNPRAFFNPVFLACAALSLCSTFMLGGSRGYLFSIIAAGFFVVIFRTKQISKPLLGIALIVGLFALGLLGALRSQFQQAGAFDLDKLSNAVETFSTAQKELLARTTLRKAAYPILFYVPQDEAYLFGKTYLAAAVVWVPRQFWPDKPGLIDGLVGKTFFDANVGIPPGPLGEAYWNFGYLGIPLIFIAFGCFHKWLYGFFLRYKEGPGAFLLYILLLFNLYPTSSSVIGALLVVVPVWFLLVISGVIKNQNSHL